MIIELDFVFSKKYLNIPNVHIDNIHNCFMQFFKWMDNNPECKIKSPSGEMAYYYDEYDFVKYINETIAVKHQEAFFVDYTDNIKIDGTILFD